jgi:hypothetical protein
VGTTFSFSLSEPGSVQLAFTRALSGRRSGRRCLAPTRRNGRARRCTRNLAAGQLRLSGHAGSNRIAFYGKLSAHRRLSLGSYTVTISVSAFGRTSRRQTLRFTVVLS